MSCVNPNYIKCSLDIETGALSYKFLGNARYSDPKSYGNFDSLTDRGYFYITAPCRHCLGCHIDYSRTWANRMLLELRSSGKAIFITLTYNNEHVPFTDRGVMTLSKRDVQLFFKRLRKHFSKHKIRYFIAGEYGSKNYRPHYHAIIFGLGLSDLLDLRVIGSNEVKDAYYTSSLIEQIWSNGFITIGDVNFKTCAYVSRYVLKKHYGLNLRQLNGAIPEFILSSRRPGIGLSDFEKYLERDSDFITLSSSDGVHTFSIPKAFRKKGRNCQPIVDKSVLLDYSKFNQANERLKTELEWSGDTYDSYLRKYYCDLKSRVFNLPERR